MNKMETVNFLKKIKSYYNNFSIDEYVINEWADRLKPYDIENVYQKLDEHLKGSYKDEIPKIYFITRSLSKAKEKQTTDNTVVRCQYCNKKVGLKYYDNHVERHNSVYYIKHNEGRIRKCFNEQQLMEMPGVEFNKFYMKFLIEIEKISTDPLEKFIIGKIFEECIE